MLVAKPRNADLRLKEIKWKEEINIIARYICVWMGKHIAGYAISGLLDHIPQYTLFRPNGYQFLPSDCIYLKQ